MERKKVEKLHIHLFPMVFALTLMNDAASLSYFPPSLFLSHTQWLQEGGVCVCMCLHQ